MPHPPTPCCVPTKQRLAQLDTSIRLASARPRVTAGSLDNMVRLESARFWMRGESPEAFPADGEGPVREFSLRAFYISKYAVANRDFARFVPAASPSTSRHSEHSEKAEKRVCQHHQAFLPLTGTKYPTNSKF